MRSFTRVLTCVVSVSLGLTSQYAFAVPSEDPGQSEVEALKREILEMKRDYEARLRALEERVEDAEHRVGETEEPAETDTRPEETTLMDTASNIWTEYARPFNPAISAILQGRAAYLEGGGGSQPLSGFPIGAETDRGREGLSLGESELVLSANVDDKLYGFFDVSFDQDEIGIEEAYLSTLSLPFGFGIKGGKFLSAIGYHNARHSHTWDFVDAPLVYDAMLDSSLSDAGVQLRWVAPTDLYLELGGEVLRGDAFPAAGAANDGFGSATAFAKISGDVDESNSWMFGASFLRADADGRQSQAPDGTPVLFDGSTDLVIADLVWKWAPLGNFRERNFTFQTEYMHRHDDGDVALDVGSGPYRSRQDGFYVQGVYQFLPRWRVGLRYGQVFGDNEFDATDPSTDFLDMNGSSSRRISTMIDFSNSEFSRFRLQYSLESGDQGDDSLIYLQYIISIGSHGAHEF